MGTTATVLRAAHLGKDRKNRLVGVRVYLWRDDDAPTLRLGVQVRSTREGRNFGALRPITWYEGPDALAIAERAADRKLLEAQKRFRRRVRAGTV